MAQGHEWMNYQKANSQKKNELIEYNISSSRLCVRRNDFYNPSDCSCWRKHHINVTHQRWKWCVWEWCVRWTPIHISQESWIGLFSLLVARLWEDKKIGSEQRMNKRYEKNPVPRCAKKRGDQSSFVLIITASVTEQREYNNKIPTLKQVVFLRFPLSIQLLAITNIAVVGDYATRVQLLRETSCHYWRIIQADQWIIHSC